MFVDAATPPICSSSKICAANVPVEIVTVDVLAITSNANSPILPKAARVAVVSLPRICLLPS